MYSDDEGRQSERSGQVEMSAREQPHVENVDGGAFNDSGVTVEQEGNEAPMGQINEGSPGFGVAASGDKIGGHEDDVKFEAVAMVAAKRSSYIERLTTPGSLRKSVDMIKHKDD